MAARKTATQQPPANQSGPSEADSKQAEETENESLIVHVTASANRRRAGINFPKGQSIAVNVDELSDDQQNALANDPVLKISK